MRVLSIGEILWDIFPDQELLGGAALNFSANAARLGNSVALITAVGNDDRGKRACDTMQSLGLRTDLVQVAEHEATGVAHVSTTAEGEASFEIPRPAAFDAVTINPETISKIKPDWMYFGTLLQMEPHIEQGIEALSRAMPAVRCFYDMNLRRGHWNLPLVQRLSRMASVLKLNESEAKILDELSKTSPAAFSLESFCEDWATQYAIQTICITLGSAGCCVYDKGSFYIVPGYPAAVQDSVGAGDAFAAAFLHGYHRRWPIVQTARFANALGSVVASRAGATPQWTMQECLEIASEAPTTS